MKPTVNKHMIFDYFAGKSTPMQKRLVGEWLRKTDNQEKYYQWLVEWGNQSPQYIPELSKNLDEYVRFMQQHPAELNAEEIPEQEDFQKASRPFWKIFLVAATLLFSLGFLGWQNRDTLMYETFQTSFNETENLKLSDGTQVVMNANSQLRVPRFGFGIKTREVLLSGEANFSVTHTLDDQKFIVKAENNLEVVVLGTEFTVYSRQRGSKVVLNKGKVQLRYKEGNNNKEVMMKPGDLVTLDPKGRTNVRKTATPQNYAAWAAHRFVFEGTSLHELTYLFEENFGLKIKIESEELKQMTLYGTFQAESAEELLKALTDAADLTYTRANDTISIDYDQY